jgi:inosine-uridine nucleoside N-ribohydrolase
VAILIDTDNALGSRSGDVDDGLAIAALLRSGVPVAALSSVGGNAGEAEADCNNRALGALCGYPGPYLRGVRTAEAADRIDVCPELWSSAPVRVLALGPLTNVAAVLPVLRSSAIEVVLVGGNISSRGRFPPFWPHEFNLTKDREAACAVFASDLPLTIVPLDVARRLRVGEQELARLEGALGRYIRQHSERWLRRSRWLHGPGGFSAFDLLAAATVFAPATVSIEETTARAHRNLWLEFGQGGRPVRLVRDFDGTTILERFQSLINSSPPLLPPFFPQ